MIDRRSFLVGIGTALAAPAIVKAEHIMKVRTAKLIVPPNSVTLPPMTVGQQYEICNLSEAPLHVFDGARSLTIIKSGGNAIFGQAEKNIMVLSGPWLEEATTLPREASSYSPFDGPSAVLFA